MQSEVVTTDLSLFGFRERAELAILLNAWNIQGLPDGFYNDEVVPMFNRNSGNVFLTNSEYEVAMMNGNDLESFYVLPYSGIEGFYEDLKIDYKADGKNWHKDDRDYFKQIRKYHEKECDER